MEIRSIDENALIITAEENEKICQALVYCIHRINKHGSRGLKNAGINVKFLHDIVENLKLILPPEETDSERKEK